MVLTKDSRMKRKHNDNYREGFRNKWKKQIHI